MSYRGNNKNADRNEERKRMVEEQIKNRGIHDERIIQAMIEVPRHRFVDQGQQAFAYEDGPLPIGHGQTISQPYIVAFMIEALMPASSHRVLEIEIGRAHV